MAERPRVSWLVWACAALAVLHAASFLAAGPCDDDYIVYRYARNLVDGLGPVFNAGERAEGFTVPLWMLLVAAGLKLGLAAETVSRALSLASVAAATWAVGAAWERGRTRALGNRSSSAAGRAPWPALLVAASPVLAYHAALGLGTALLAALLAGWLALDERAGERGAPSRAGAALLGLACLLRPEALLFAVPYAWREARAGRLVALPLALGPLAAWQGFRVAYYGAWLPTSFGVKRLPLFVDLGYGLAYFARATLECGVGVLLALALARVLRRRVAARADELAPARPSPTERTALLGATLYVLFVIYAGGDYMPLARFYVPVLPVLILLACRAVAALLPARDPAGPPGALSPAATVVLGVLLVAGSWPELRRPELFRRHAAGEERWVAIGKTLAWLAPPGTKIAASPVGAIGYESGQPIVDLLGITHRAFLGRAPDLVIRMKGHHRHDAEWALAQEPAVVILGNGSFDPSAPEVVVSGWERDLYEHPRFAAEYVPMVVPIEDSYPLIYWQRRAAPLLPGAADIAGAR